MVWGKVIVKALVVMQQHDMCWRHSNAGADHTVIPHSPDVSILPCIMYVSSELQLHNLLPKISTLWPSIILVSYDALIVFAIFWNSNPSAM
jgi:hypothetical protein